MCHNLMTSESDMDDHTTIEPVTVDHWNANELLDVLAFIKTRAPLETFRAPPSAVYLHPIDLRVPREIRFLFKSGTCLTLVNVLIMPPCILIHMVPFPTALHLWIIPH